MALSVAERICTLDVDEIEAWLHSLDPGTLASVARRDWWYVGRPEQFAPPGDWDIWLILSGRGWGKTRTGAEWIVDQMVDHPVDRDGLPTEWLMVAETITDARDILIEGPSGVLNVLRRRRIRFRYAKAPKLMIVLETGQKLHAQGADDADVGRGLNLAGVWGDEIVKWQYPGPSWIEGIAPALRTRLPGGAKPRAMITTTPKPIKLLRDWAKRTDGSIHITRGSTFDNAANLSQAALEAMRREYEGTRIGRQELYGELLEDIDGALWSARQIDADRVATRPPLDLIVVAVDPAVTSGEDADETGIIVAGRGTDGRGYLLADRSLRDTPLTWAKAVIRAFDDFNANYVVIETNQGGDALVALLHTERPHLPVVTVTAKKGKRVRAEPVSAMSEKHLISHVGPFDKLEDQLTTWTPEEVESPDRMDAYVYAFLQLLDTGDSLTYLQALARKCRVCSAPLNGNACLIHGIQA